MHATRSNPIEMPIHSPVDQTRTSKHSLRSSANRPIVILKICNLILHMAHPSLNRPGCTCGVESQLGIKEDKFNSIRHIQCPSTRVLVLILSSIEPASPLLTSSYTPMSTSIVSLSCDLALRAHEINNIPSTGMAARISAQSAHVGHELRPRYDKANPLDF